MEIIKYDTISSTNLLAKEFLKSGKKAAPFCIVADKQTGGYGQAGRPYYCPHGGLYMSLIISKEDFPYKFAAGFAAVCVAGVISRFVTDGRKTTIKWVNDINLDNRKVGGVLIEKVGSCVIIGIGINLFQTEDVPSDLKDRIGFVSVEISPHDIINKIIETKLTDEQVLAEYKKYCDVDGLNVDGSLIVVGKDGKKVKKFSNII